MRKTEFLQELREALDGEVSASVIQSNISYYDQYIRQEAAKGRREEEVIEESWLSDLVSAGTSASC